MNNYNHYMSADRHQAWVNLEPQRMSIRRYEAMLEMCKNNGQCTQEELDAMQAHIDDLKMKLWLA